MIRVTRRRSRYCLRNLHAYIKIMIKKEKKKKRQAFTRTLEDTHTHTFTNMNTNINTHTGTHTLASNPTGGYQQDTHLTRRISRMAAGVQVGALPWRRG